MCMIFVYTVNPMEEANSEIWKDIRIEFFCSKETSAMIWVYLTILSEAIVFSVRVPADFFWVGKRPTIWLVAGVLATDVLVSVLAIFWKDVYTKDVGLVWVFAFGSFLAVDALKVLTFRVILGQEAGETISYQEFLEHKEEIEIVDDVEVRAAAMAEKMEKEKVKRFAIHRQSTLTERELKGRTLSAAPLSKFASMRSLGARQHDKHLKR